MIGYLLIGAIVAGFLLGGYRARRSYGYQNQGEALVSWALLEHFSGPDYHLMNHLTLRVDNGTTQIDHLLVSRFGVFVIETKDFRGWIFADARDAKWTQVLFRAKFRFQNPLIQNARHVEAVRARLDFLPPEAVRSVVVFAGDAEFKTPRPEGVFHLDEAIAYLRSHSVAVMSLNRMQFCVGRLETDRLAISGKTDVEHIKNLARWRGRAS